MKVALLGGKGRFDMSTGDGVPVYMYEIYTNLSRLQKPKKFELTKVEYKREHLLGDAYGWLYFVLKSATDDFTKFDIVHNVDVKPFFPHNMGKAVYATTVHDFQPLIEPELDADLTYSVKGRFKLAFEVRHSLKLALKSDYLIAVSTLTRDDAVSLGYDKEKVFVVNHGIDDIWRRPVKNRKSNSKPYRVGYVGGLRTRKGIDFAIGAFKHVHEIGISFDVWGKPIYEYKNLVNLARNDDRISFKGFAPQKRIVDIYDSFDVFVWPSLYEGFGMPILEAQARGLPVIIRKDSKIPEEARKYCLEAKNQNHMAEIIERLYTDGYDQRQRRMAMDYALSFTWEKAAENTINAYKKML